MTHALRPSESRAFKIFKYGTYVILTINATIFASYEWSAAPYLFEGGVPFSQVIAAFPVTMDACAWLTLLWLFELETSVIPDEKIHGPLKWGLLGIRILCYGLGFYAFQGFLENLYLVQNFVPVDIANICNLKGAGYSVMIDLPEFVPLDVMDCQEVGGWAPFFQLSGRRILVDWETLIYAQRMGWLELFNDAAWLLLVLVFEADVQLKERDLLAGTLARVSTVVKGLVYAVLLSAAIAWGVLSGFQDFADAALWLAAFVFIDLNLVDWRWTPSPATAL